MSTFKPKKVRENAEIYIRDPHEADLPFIFNSWLRSFRNSSFCRYVDNTIYFTEHHKLVEKILKRSTVKIACSPQNPEDVYGYICHENIDGFFVLHYAYTKQSFRNLGIFRALLATTNHNAEIAGIHSHSTIACAWIMPKLNLIYHPYLLINYMDTEAKGESAASKSSTTEPQKIQ